MSVIRTIHNRENPYVQLNKAALWDEDLPLECVGLWARCMSRPSGWEFYLSELATSCGINVQTIRKYIKKLIDCGYAIRQHNRDHAKGRFDKCDYTFFEFKLTDEEKSLYAAELKKCLPQTKKPCTVTPSSVNTLLLKNESSSSLRSEEEKKKEYYNTSEVQEPAQAPSEPPTSVAEELSIFFFQKLKEEKKDFKEPNLKKWSMEIDRLIRIDKRSPEEVQDFIVWVRQDESFWKAVCLSPENLRKNWEKIAAAMHKNSFHDNVKDNKEYAVTLKKVMNIKELRWDAKFVFNDLKHKEVPFSLPHETFKQVINQMFDLE